MRSIVAIMSAVALFSSCRRDQGEDDLKRSCATVQRSGPAIATPECLDDLQRTQSPVLKYYKAVPQASAVGKIEQYFLVEKDGREPAITVAKRNKQVELKLESSVTAPGTKVLREGHDR